MKSDAKYDGILKHGPGHGTPMFSDPPPEPKRNPYGRLPNFEEIHTEFDASTAGAVSMVFDIIGIRGPINSHVIETECGISGAQVRAVVAFLRKKLYPICSGMKGYWFAKDIQDHVNTIEHMRRRASAITAGADSLQESLDYMKARDMHKDLPGRSEKL